ncbi:uncharacterized protein RCC_11199 [Ramularia collo-cygni]|uniref:Zn(2)-C6 fungal-type domain-containing protein n=1 Tax=Ramularia collo-cygni TaxID=112498 RepID=A0A2D3V5B9_9PEZI|nr:uncharacterized protein RCC_11199 [Ramularia collo-cygni]CZT25467.1 uncharacterized protein RCC_11199 [Ramularia collo-cygni]
MTSTHKSSQSRIAGSKRLRKSCDTCSQSKVGCDKVKPVCERCAERRLECSYSVARRPGRVSQRHQKDSQGSIARSRDEDSLASGHESRPLSRSRPLSASSKSPGSDMGRKESPWKPSETCINLEPVAHTPDPALINLHPTNENMSFDDLYASMVENGLFGTGAPSPNISQDINTAYDSNGNQSATTALDWTTDLFGFDEISMNYDTLPMLDFVNSPKELSIFEPSNTFSVEIDSRSQTHSPAHQSKLPISSQVQKASKCSCLETSALLLQRRSAPEGDGSRKDIVESILESNCSLIEQTENMLQCTCAGDDSVLVMIFMITFKILGSYARAFAALDSPPRTPCIRPRVVAEGGFSQWSRENVALIEENSELRSSTQRILSELHKVQGLINRASHGYREQRRSSSSLSSSSSSTLSSLASLAVRTPSITTEVEVPESDDNLKLPDALLDQLELDLRKRLRALSTSVIEKLRCF